MLSLFFCPESFKIYILGIYYVIFIYINIVYSNILPLNKIKFIIVTLVFIRIIKSNEIYKLGIIIIWHKYRINATENIFIKTIYS
jgi:hypothetical protein